MIPQLLSAIEHKPFVEHDGTKTTGQEFKKQFIITLLMNEWNKNKPTTHDESQMGYGRGDYEQARKDSEKVWNDPNAHVGGPCWVGKNEGYESWAKRQQEVQNTPAQ